MWRDGVYTINMKKIILALLLLLSFSIANAQIDVHVYPGKNSYVTLAKSAVWGSSGLGGANNYFLFQPLNSDNSECVFIFNNNPTNAHPFVLTFWQTPDPSVTAFLNNANGRWTLVQSQAISSSSGNQFTVNASSSIGVYVKNNGAALFAVSITGSGSLGGSPDTADVIAVQTTQSGCAGSSPSNLQLQGNVNGAFGNASGVWPLVQCDNTTSQTVAQTTTVTLVGGQVGRNIYVCQFSVTSLAETTPAAPDQLATGSSGTCASLTGIWSFALPAVANAAPFPYQVGSNTGFFYHTVTAGQPLCFLHPTSGGSAFVSISYTIF